MTLPLVVSAQDSTWSLEKCIQYAIEHNLSLQQSRLTTENNEITLKQSQANRVPVLSGTATQQFSFGRSIDPFSNQFINQNIRSNNFTVSGSMVLFNGFQIQNQIRQNKLNYEASVYETESTKNNIILSVGQYYYQILLAQEQVENAKLQIQSTESQIEMTGKLVRAGSVPEINLIQLQAQLANDKVTLTNAENQVYLAKVNLMQVLNLPVTDGFAVEAMPADTSVIYSSAVTGKSTEEIYQSALSTQPAIKGLQLRREGSLMGWRAAKGGRYPRLSLNGQVYTGYSSARSLNTFQGYQTTPIGFLQSNPGEVVTTYQPIYTKGDYPFSRQLSDNISQSVNLSLYIPILNNRQVRSNIERADLNLRSARLQEESGKVQLRQNIEQAYANMVSARNAFNSSSESLKLQEQTFVNTERRFNLGMMNPYDFLIQKNNLFRARVDYSQTKYQYIYNLKVLEFYQTNQL